VFADFGEPADADPSPPSCPSPSSPSSYPSYPSPPSSRSPLKVPLPADAPLRREWTLVCEARDYLACVSGWEFPGQQGATAASRRFEVIWSVDPQVVRNAATICAQLAESLSPGLDLLANLPSDPPSPASGDLHRAVGLLNRMTGYLERATRP
jgi:MerR family transcriptional regulator, light-induced transcriptional regulator